MKPEEEVSWLEYKHGVLNPMARIHQAAGVLKEAAEREGRVVTKITVESEEGITYELTYISTEGTANDCIQKLYAQQSGSSGDSGSDRSDPQGA